MKRTVKCKVGGYRYTGQFRYDDTEIVDWFAVNQEMPSKKEALKWMREKREAYAKHGIKVGFSYHENVEQSYIVEMDDTTIKLV